MFIVCRLQPKSVCHWIQLLFYVPDELSAVFNFIFKFALTRSVTKMFTEAYKKSSLYNRSSNFFVMRCFAISFSP